MAAPTGSAASYSPGDPKPLAAYAGITGAWVAALAGFEVARRGRGRELPERVGLGDGMLLAVATFKLSRLATKARVTAFIRAPFTRYVGEAGPSEVSEEPRGTGLRRAIGELAVCPYCVGEWIAAGLMAAYIRDPRSTRTVGTLLTVAAAADVLHQGWTVLNDRT